MTSAERGLRGGAAAALAEELIIPRGTVVFGELDERITSSERKFRVGYPVDGHVWKDVVVDGDTVIAAGTPMELRISKLDDSDIGGEGGSLRVMAVSVKAVDGTEITLSGGYDQSGGNRYGGRRGGRGAQRRDVTPARLPSKAARTSAARRRMPRSTTASSSANDRRMHSSRCAHGSSRPGKK